MDKFFRWLARTVLFTVLLMIGWTFITMVVSLYVPMMWEWNMTTFVLFLTAGAFFGGLIADPLSSEERRIRNADLYFEERGFTRKQVEEYVDLLRKMEPPALTYFGAHSLEREAELYMNLRAYFERLERLL